MEDADLDDISARLIRSCMRNTRQTCCISTRLLAPTSRYDEIVDMVTETLSVAPQGDPLDPAHVFGPSANNSQYHSVLEHLESAAQDGAHFTTAGESARLIGELAEGLFIQPTVLAEVTPDMRVAREEIFGPLITILKYTEEAISLANNTEFGLGGIVSPTIKIRPSQSQKR